LHPGNARSQSGSRIFHRACVRIASRICFGDASRHGLRKIQRHPGVARQMVFGSVAASVKIEGQRRGAFFERLAEQVNPAHNQWQGFRKSFAAAAFCAGLVQIDFSTGFAAGVRDALLDAPCETPDDVLHGAMRERIALLAGRIEKRKRARMGISRKGNLRGGCPRAQPPSRQ
jgi:hypothetical protein